MELVLEQAQALGERAWYQDERMLSLPAPPPPCAASRGGRVGGRRLVAAVIAAVVRQGTLIGLAAAAARALAAAAAAAGVLRLLAAGLLGMRHRRDHLLRGVDFFSPPLALRLLLAPPPLALARSLCALLFCVLAFPPLLAASARPDLPEEEDDFEEDELRDAMTYS